MGRGSSDGVCMDREICYPQREYECNLGGQPQEFTAMHTTKLGSKTFPCEIFAMS
jgi:hypothetical protein